MRGNYIKEAIDKVLGEFSPDTQDGIIIKNSMAEKIVRRIAREAWMGREPVEAARLLFEHGVGKPRQQIDVNFSDTPYAQLSDEELARRERELLEAPDASFEILKPEIIQDPVNEVNELL
jgi:hypothetical protein